LLEESPDPEAVWIYGVAQEVPRSFPRQLAVARLARAWKEDESFRKVFEAAGIPPEPPADPTVLWASTVPPAGESKVLISYARSDGLLVATRLHAWLNEKGIPVWPDLVGTEEESGWWLQVTEALNRVRFMVLLLTPSSIRSKIFRKEWRYARQHGVCVSTVMGVPENELALDSMPRRMRDAKRYDLIGHPEDWTKLLNDLSRSCQTPRAPFMVEDLPENLVERPNEFKALISLLYDPQLKESIAKPAALLGAGGFGKTTLAKALCHDDDILAAFDDGILWVRLGEKPGNLNLKVLDLIEVLSGRRPGFQTLDAAGPHLEELLADRDILMVIDDVWGAGHLAPFLRGGNRCARLITTRNRDTLPAATRTVSVDAMRREEALQLLSTGLPKDQRAELEKLAARLGEWPVLLKLANSLLREKVTNKQPLSEALVYVVKALEKHGLRAFEPATASLDTATPEGRQQAVRSVVSASLDLLDAKQQARYRELAVFPEDVDIPLSTLQRLWGATSGLDEFDTEELCQRLYGLSLLLNLDLARRVIRLHDVMRRYLGEELAKTENTVQLHAMLVDAWGDPFHLPDDYAWRWYTYHLHESGRQDKVRRLLLDFNWIKAKLDNTEITALAADFEAVLSFRGQEGDSSSLNSVLGLMHSALRLSAHALAMDKTQLAGQITGRLLGENSPDIQRTLSQAAGWRGAPWLRPVSPSLTIPGGPLLRILAAHTGGVTAVMVTTDGKEALSASEDNTLKLWDLASGRNVWTATGHTSGVSAVVVTLGGEKALSGSRDKTIKLWNLTTQAAKDVLTMAGHTGPVRGVALTQDGKRALTASEDKTVKVWDLADGQVLRTLRGHTGRVLAVAVTQDGKQALTASQDKTVKVWDLADGQVLRTLNGHTDWVNGVTLTPDGKKALSASRDGTVKVWSLLGGDEIRTLAGHTDWVNSVAVTPDGKQAYSASDDRTLRAWDLTVDRERPTLPGHVGRVNAVAVAPREKQALSASDDKKIKLWDLESGQAVEPLVGHAHRVTSIVVTPDRRQVLSASLDNTVRVWDLESRQEQKTKTLTHRWGVTAVTMTPDSKWVLSASFDRMVKVWDLESQQEVWTLKGHSSWIWGLAVTPDSKWVLSASVDRTVKVWDLESRREVWTLEGHAEAVRAVAVTPDGKHALSASEDKTMKVWDLGSGLEVHRLIGHTDSVTALAVTPNGKHLVSASNDRALKVWSLETGKVVASLGTDGGLLCCAVAPDGTNVIAGDSIGRLHFLQMILS